MRIKKLFFIILGFLCLILGSVGIILPFLQTVPFYLCTVFFFAKSSRRLHIWFIGTKLYKKHLESFVKKEGMTRTTKVGIMLSVTLIMVLSAFLMLRKGVWAPCIILGIIWLIHVFVFTRKIKTIP